MSDAASPHFSQMAQLRNGTPVCIRSIRPDDRQRVIAAFRKLEPETIYTRFFSAKKDLSEADLGRIEGSDFAERVTYDGSENLLDQAGIDHRYSDDILNLRGGANNVSYSPLETSISAQVSVTAHNPALPPANAVGTDPLAWGNIAVDIDFTNGEFGTALAGGGTHAITSYSADNPVSSGSLKLEASQDAEDSVTFDFDTDKVFVLGQSPGVISVSIGTAATMVLTGFEVLQDFGGSDDTYTMEDLDDVLGDLFLVDDLYSDAPGDADRDTLKITDEEAINYNNGAAGESNEADTVKLESFNDAFAFDFSILDISELNDNDLRFVRGDDDDQDDDLILNAADTDYEGPADRGGRGHRDLLHPRHCRAAAAPVCRLVFACPAIQFRGSAHRVRAWDRPLRRRHAEHAGLLPGSRGV